MYLSHRMRSIFPTRFAGFAVTVALKKETNHDSEALKACLRRSIKARRIPCT